MLFLLIRHLESIKNVNEHHFTSLENDEALTDKGIEQGEELAKIIGEYVLNSCLVVKSIYCANSTRSVETAKIISVFTSAIIKTYSDLNSIRDNAFAGMSEAEVAKIDPEFIYQLKLYRLGLYNSFQIKHIEQNEKATDFETRVVRALIEILNNSEEENLKIIVLHRSSMLASLFYFVKLYYNFPKDHYGYVQIDVGNICLLETKNNSLEIKAINKPPHCLREYY